MKILIFGGNGFLGNALTSIFDKENIQYYTVSRSNKDSTYNIDISDFDDFTKLPFNFFNVIINCATVLPGKNYLDSIHLNEIYKTNILGSQNICKWMDSQNAIKKIVNCSTLVVIGKPWAFDLDESAKTYPSGNHVIYASSKLTQELIFKTFADTKKIALAQVRFSALYGETMKWNGIVCNLIDQARANKRIDLKNASKVSADFLHVADAAKIIHAAVINGVTGIIHGASGVETSILDLAEMIINKVPYEVQINNNEDDTFREDRSVINITKLKTIINTGKFIEFSQGLDRLMRL